MCAAYNAQTPPPARAVDADAAAAHLGAGPPASQGMFAGCASLPGKHCASFFDAEVQALLADQGGRSRSLQAAVDGAAGRGAAPRSPYSYAWRAAPARSCSASVRPAVDGPTEPDAQGP